MLGSREMPGARWFEGAELNYAEVALPPRSPTTGRRSCPSRSGTRCGRSSAAELRETVAAAAAGLRRLGVGRGDRVVAVIPNIPEAVVAFLACASLGAIWASCSPDFGTQSLVDRFAQIEPTVLIAVDGYTYGGKRFDRRAVIDELRAALPGLERTVLVPYLDPDAARTAAREMRLGGPPRRSGRAADVRAGPVRPSALGALLVGHDRAAQGDRPRARRRRARARRRRSACMFDVRPGDRMSWFTTTGWMMWNFLVGSMLVGGVPVLYDGSPGYPGPRRALGDGGAGAGQPVRDERSRGSGRA